MFHLLLGLSQNEVPCCSVRPLPDTLGKYTPSRATIQPFHFNFKQPRSQLSKNTLKNHIDMLGVVIY